MRVDYEEKTYESYFNSELSSRTPIYFPIGQALEGFLGFDSSFYSTEILLFSLFGYTSPSSYPKGVLLRDIADEMENFLNISIKKTPEFKTNLLFQFKKPEYISSPRGREWSYWKTPYFRYEIYLKQQNLLSHIAKSFRKDVFLCYASPALKDVNDLVRASQKKKIIDSSNFRKVLELDGHHVNTYTQSGKDSIACSEKETLNNFDLINTLEQLSREPTFNEFNNAQFIINFSNKINEIMYADEYYSNSFRILNEKHAYLQNYKLSYSHIVMRNFMNLTGTRWLIKL